MLHPLTLLAAAVVAGGGWLLVSAPPQGDSSAISTQSASSTQSTTPQASTPHSTTIREPAGPPRTIVGHDPESGEPVTAACSTCHATRSPNFENRIASDLNEFHQGMHVAHGQITCLSCHNSTDYDTLKRADGSSIEYPKVMRLCAQCHGSQTTDFQHGAHGGVNGYWDLSRGPRTKNNCIDCHNPHAPKFPAMRPTFKPIDRFLNSEEEVEHD